MTDIDSACAAMFGLAMVLSAIGALYVWFTRGPRRSLVFWVLEDVAALAALIWVVRSR